MSAAAFWWAGVALGLIIALAGIAGLIWFSEPAKAGETRRARLDRKAAVERAARSRL